MTTEEIKDWLARIGKNRDWLADKLKATKGSVDQWFSRGFPDWAIQIITYCMDDVRQTGGLEVRFSPKEWKLIDTAMSQAGYHEQNEFFRDAINVYATDILKAEPHTRESMALVSESPATYDPGQAALQDFSKETNALLTKGHKKQNTKQESTPAGRDCGGGQHGTPRKSV